jgi:Domain of unknown function (DUF1843)
MATQGVIYDPTIRDALRRKDVTLAELKSLRQQTVKLIKQQGDLQRALVKLEKEIKRRSG